MLQISVNCFLFSAQHVWCKSGSVIKRIMYLAIIVWYSWKLFSEHSAKPSQVISYFRFNTVFRFKLFSIRKLWRGSNHSVWLLTRHFPRTFSSLWLFSFILHIEYCCVEALERQIELINSWENSYQINRNVEPDRILHATCFV
jgi:hypothetical protein